MTQITVKDVTTESELAMLNSAIQCYKSIKHKYIHDEGDHNYFNDMYNSGEELFRFASQLTGHDKGQGTKRSVIQSYIYSEIYEN